MTSMRIDGGKRAEVWGKRFKTFVDAAEMDGCDFYFHSEDRRMAVTKNGEGFDSNGNDITKEMFG